MGLATKDLVYALSFLCENFQPWDGKVQTASLRNLQEAEVTSPMPLTVLVLVHLILGEAKVNKETRVRTKRMGVCSQKTHNTHNN